MPDTPAHQWKDAQGNPLSCREKIKVLEQNMRDLTRDYQDALDDAVLMGCAPQAFKSEVLAMVEALQPRVKERS